MTFAEMLSVSTESSPSVVREPQHRQRDEHGHAVRAEEQRVLRHLLVWPPRCEKRPVAVESIETAVAAMTAMAFGRERSIREHTAARVHENVEESHVDNQEIIPDAELPNSVDETGERAQRAGKEAAARSQQFHCRHPITLPTDRNNRNPGPIGCIV